MHVLRNSEDAKRLGKELSIREIRSLVRDFKDFNPFHILASEEDAVAYLTENWEGRILDLQHFGIVPREDRRKRRRRPRENEESK